MSAPCRRPTPRSNSTSPRSSRSRDALAWWIPLLGDALVCLTTFAIDASRYAGAITVTREPVSWADDPFARVFPGTVLRTSLFSDVAPPPGPVLERYAGVAWPGGAEPVKPDEAVSSSVLDRAEPWRSSANFSATRRRGRRAGAPRARAGRRAELVLPLLVSKPLVTAGATLGRGLSRFGLRIGSGIAEMATGFASLQEAQSRRAFVHTARS